MNIKPNLIALHGWAMGPGVFEQFSANLGGRFELYTPALPGYPTSPWSAQQTLPRQIESMAADLPAGHLMGWSLGGLYALHLYHCYPQQFSGLTLVCFNPCFVSRSDWPCGVEIAMFDRFAEDLQRGWEFTIRRFLALQLLGQSDARSRLKSLLQILSADGAPAETVLQGGLDLLRQTDSRGLLRSLQRPVQMIFAENDPLVPVDCAQQMGQIARTIQVECIADAAHLPFLSHGDRFAELLGASIRQC